MSKLFKFQLVLVIILISVGTFYGGYYFGKSGYLIELRRNPPDVKITNQYPGDSEIDFALFWEVWDIVSENYLLRPVDSQAMLYGAIEGMVGSLGDPYTSYLPPTINESVNNSLNGTYTGIGAELAIRDNRLIVVAPLDGSPAEEAGVMAGDVITEIEDESTIGMSITEAVTRIRGEAGTISKLTLQRDNGVPFSVLITRGVINIKSVTWEDKGNGTAYIRVSRFGGDTNADWAQVVSELNAEMAELDAVILDLRGNPGGYLQSAVYLAEEFYTDAPVLFQENALGEKVPFNAERIGAFQTLPKVIILIDGGSASASEILASALKVNVDAVLVGQKSFGKGTIQDARDFGDGSGLHLTIAKWLTADEVWVHEVGIEPDVEVENTREELLEEIDAQLNKAIELAEEI
jgi:carboxyl-terminal processing protease